MGKKKQYKDDYTGDVQLIQKRHQKFKMLMTALCVTGIVAAGSATYVLMNPAQTMTKEGIDEMDPNEDFVVSDDDTVAGDALFAEDQGENVENYDNVPLIEEADNNENAPADAFPVEEPSAEPAMPGAEPAPAALIPEDVEETETEIAEAVQPETTAPEAPAPEAPVTEAAAVETPASETEIVEEAAAPETEAAEETTVPETEVKEIVGVSETEVGETAETEAPIVTAVETELQETEAPETEEVAVQNEETEAPETEAAETEAAETEEPQSESATEPAESETQAAQIREKSKDEVYVETEGEILDEKWINSVGLEVKTEDGWNAAKAEEGSAIEVDADQTLRFRVTYTVQPGTLSPEMRTLIYQIPKEITRVEESYGEIVDADERVLANYAIGTTGIIRVTFTEEIAELNEAGTKVTCKIEFRTQASNLAQ